MDFYDQLVEEVVGTWIDNVQRELLDHAKSQRVGIANIDTILRVITRLFEECLIDFIAYDMYLTEQAAGNSASSANSTTGLEKLKEYVSLKSEETLPFSKYIFDKYPQFSEKIEIIKNNLINFLKTTITRTMKDQKILIQLFINNPITAGSLSTIGPSFFSGTSSELVISEITINFSGKEFHRGQQQVLIIDFKTNHSHIGKFIYKPSSLVMDVFIVGNVTKLKEIHEQYPFLFEDGIDLETSIAQLVNRHLDSKDMLPTYLIVPMIWKDVTQSYGYIEFLAHDSSVSPEITQNLKTQLLNAKTRAEAIKLTKDFKETVSTESDRILRETYDRFRNGEPVHSITGDANDVVLYSRLCGQWAAVFRMFGIMDMHMDNMIIHNKKPYPIDLEFCMSLSVSCLEDTGSCEHMGGSFSPFAITFIAWKFLCPAQSDQSNNIYYAKVIDKAFFPGHNHLYQEIEAFKVSPIVPDRVKFLEGFREVMGIFQLESVRIQQLLHSQFVRSGFARIAPFATADFISMIKNIFEPLINSIGKKTFDERRQEEFERWKNKIVDAANCSRCCLPIMSRLPIPQEQIIDTTKNPPIFLSLNNYAFQELKTNNVPCYYVSVANNALLCGDGSIAQATQEEKQILQSLLGENHLHVVELNNYYLQITPLDNINGNLQSLVSQGINAFMNDAENFTQDPKCVLSNSDIRGFEVQSQSGVDRNVERGATL